MPVGGGAHDVFAFGEELVSMLALRVGRTAKAVAFFVVPTTFSVAPETKNVTRLKQRRVFRYGSHVERHNRPVFRILRLPSVAFCAKSREFLLWYHVFVTKHQPKRRISHELSY